MQEAQELTPSASRGAKGGLDADRAQHLGLGGHPHHGRVHRHEQQLRVAAPHAAGVHLRLEEVGGPLHQRIEHLHHAADPRIAQPAQLSHDSQQLRAADGEAEDGPHTGVDVAERRIGVTQRFLERLAQLDGCLLDHRVQQKLLRAEVVEHRLLAHAQLAGERVEGGRVVAACAEGLGRGNEHSITGSHLR